MRLESPGRGDGAALIIANLMSPLRGSAGSLCAVIPRLATWATFLGRRCGLAWDDGLILAPMPLTPPYQGGESFSPRVVIGRIMKSPLCRKKTRMSFVFFLLTKGSPRGCQRSG